MGGGGGGGGVNTPVGSWVDRWVVNTPVGWWVVGGGLTHRWGGGWWGGG